MFGKQNHSQDNTRTVTGSAILAKAVTRLPNGKYELIVVFSKSTRIEFYWVFQARSPRSPKRSWKVVGYFMRTNHTYTDFGSFVVHRAQQRAAAIVSERTPRKRRLSTIQTKTEHDSIYSDWTSDPNRSVTADRLREKSINSRRGKGAWL